MKFVIATLLAVLFAVQTAAAQSQAQPDSAPLPPTVIQNIDTGEGYNMTPATGALIGAATGLVALNVVSSGLVLAPVIGVPASNVLGGAWMGPFAFTPAVNELLFHSASVVAIAFATGTLGYFIAEE